MRGSRSRAIIRRIWCHGSRSEEGCDVTTGLTTAQIRSERIRREREWYLSEDGYLDFVRDCGAAPDAQYEPHGRLSHVVLHWTGVPDPDVPDRVLYRNKMVLWPRGSFKTQVFGVGYVAWLIAKDPNVRILY